MNSQEVLAATSSEPVTGQQNLAHLAVLASIMVDTRHGLEEENTATTITQIATIQSALTERNDLHIIYFANFSSYGLRPSLGPTQLTQEELVGT